jgi:hypothetical protein
MDVTKAMDAWSQVDEPALQFRTAAVPAVPILIEDVHWRRMRNQHIRVVRYQIPLVAHLVVGKVR